MNEEKLKQLFDALQGDENYDTGGDLNTFKKALQDSNKSKMLYETLASDENYDAGESYDVFVQSLGLKKKEQTGSEVSSDTPSLSESKSSSFVDSSFQDIDPIYQGSDEGDEQEDGNLSQEKLDQLESLKIDDLEGDQPLDGIYDDAIYDTDGEEYGFTFSKPSLNSGVKDALGDRDSQILRKERDLVVSDQDGEPLIDLSMSEVTDADIKYESAIRKYNQKLRNTFPTLGTFLEKYGVQASYLGLSQDINLDKSLTVSEIEKFQSVIQTKFRQQLEQNPKLKDSLMKPVRQGAFGQDVDDPSFLLGTIRTINEDYTAEFLGYLDDFSLTLSDVSGLRYGGAFGWMKNYLKDVSNEQWTDYREGTWKAVAETTAHLGAFFTTMAMTPQFRIAQLAKFGKGYKLLQSAGFVNKSSQLVIPRMFTQMAGTGFAAGYADDVRNRIDMAGKDGTLKFNEEGEVELSEYDPYMNAVRGGLMGMKDAAIFSALGFTAGKGAQYANRVFGFGKTGEIVTGSALDAIGFGGYNVVDQKIKFGEVKDWNRVVADLVVGAGLYAGHAVGPSNYSSSLLKRAQLRYFSAHPMTKNRALSAKGEASFYRNESIKLREKAFKTKKQTEKDALLAQADVYDGIADIKSVRDMIGKNPELYKNEIKRDNNLSPEQRNALERQVDEAASSFGVEASIKEAEASRKKTKTEEAKKETEATKEPVKKDEPIDITIEQQTALENIRDVTKKLEPILKETTPETLVKDIKDLGIDLDHVERATGRNVETIKTKQEFESFKETVKSQQEKAKQEFEKREKLPELEEGEIRVGSRIFKNEKEFEKFVKEHRDPSEIMLDTYDPKLAKIISRELDIRETKHVQELREKARREPPATPQATISSEQRKPSTKKEKTAREPEIKSKVKDKDTGVEYTLKETEKGLDIEFSKEITDKGLEIKKKVLTDEANQTIEQRRKDVIREIQKEREKIGEADFIDVGGERYKVIPKEGGEYTIMSYTQRTDKGVQKKVTNETLKRKVLEEYYKQAEMLSDAEMKIYEDKMSEVKSEVENLVKSELESYLSGRESFFQGKKPSIDGVAEGMGKKIDESMKITGDKKTVDTWQQMKKELKIEETASKRGAKAKYQDAKKKADQLKEMIANNKGLLQGLPKRVQDAALKKVTDAPLSDAKYRDAVRYLDDVITRKEYAEYENKRLAELSSIQKISSEKGLLRKGGKFKKLKQTLEAKGESPFIKKLQQVNSFFEGKGRDGAKVEKNRQKANEEIHKITEEIDVIENQSSISKDQMNRVFELRERLEVLEFANAEGMSLDRLRELNDKAKSWKEGQRSKHAIQRDIDKKESQALFDLIYDSTRGDFEVGPREQRKLEKQRKKRKQRLFQFTLSDISFGDTSWWSLNNKLARGDTKSPTKATPLFSDRINSAVGRRLRQSERLQDEITVISTEQTQNTFKEIFGVKRQGQMDRKMIDLNTFEVVPDANLYNADGSVSYDVVNGVKTKAKVEVTPMEAATLWLQWRDPYLRKSMSKPRDEGGMGYTQETINKIESFLSPELKRYSEYIYGEINRLSKIYDKAYIDQNGISMLADQDAYMPGEKEFGGRYKEVGLENYLVSSGLTSHRTMKRTGDTGPLKYKSIQDVYQGYLTETARYAAWTKTYSQLSRVYKNPEYLKLVEAKYGNEAVQSVNFFMDLYADKAYRANLASLDKYMKNLGVGILGAKAMPVIKQGMSSIYYMNDIPVKQWGDFTVLTAEMLSTTNIKGAPAPSKRVKLLKQLLFDDILVKARHNRAIEVAIGMNTYAREPVLGSGSSTKAMSYAKAPFRAASQASMMPLQVFDRLPIVNAGGAYCFTKYKELTGRRLTADILEKHISGEKKDPTLDVVLDRWDIVSTLTQQSMAQSNMSRIRYNTSFGRAMNAFTSAPAQLHRVTMSGVRDIRKGISQKNGDLAIQGIKKVALTHALGGILFEFADMNFQKPDTQGDVNKLILAAAKGNIDGIAYLGRLTQAVTDLYLDEHWAGEISVSPLVDNLNDMINSMYAFSTEVFAKKPDYWELQYQGEKFALAASAHFGVPAKGVIQIYKGATSGVLKDTSLTAIDKGLALVGVDVDTEKDELLYEFKTHELTYDQALRKIKRSMTITRDGNFYSDFKSIEKWSMQAYANGYDGAAIVARAYGNEIADEMMSRMRGQGFDYDDLQTVNGIQEILQKGDLEYRDQMYLMEEIMKLQQRNPSIANIETHNAIMKIMNKARNEHGLGFEK